MPDETTAGPVHPPSRPRLLTAVEAAEFLRLRESTLRDYARRGVVPCVRIGRHMRFVETDLVAWLDGVRPHLPAG